MRMVVLREHILKNFVFINYHQFKLNLRNQLTLNIAILFKVLQQKLQLAKATNDSRLIGMKHHF